MQIFHIMRAPQPKIIIDLYCLLILKYTKKILNFIDVKPLTIYDSLLFITILIRSTRILSEIH